MKTFVGSGTNAAVDGIGTVASIQAPRAMCVDSSLTVYFGDLNVRMITTAGIGTISLYYHNEAR